MRLVAFFAARVLAGGKIVPCYEATLEEPQHEFYAQHR